MLYICGKKKIVKGNEEYYGLSFNSDEFYNWALSADFPVYFSSVFIPPEFKIVWEKEKKCLMNNKNSTGKKSVIEKLAWNGK